MTDGCVMAAPDTVTGNLTKGQSWMHTKYSSSLEAGQCQEFDSPGMHPRLPLDTDSQITYTIPKSAKTYRCTRTISYVGEGPCFGSVPVSWRTGAPKHGLLFLGGTMKTCCHCHRSLPTSEFRKDKYKKDGLRPRCKDCQKAYDKQQCKNWPSRSTERRRKIRKKHLNTRRGKETKRRCDQRYRSKNKLKTKVRSQSLRAYPEAQPCIICGQRGERHHLSYETYTDFIWLCPEHHRAQHRT